jgi:hypothetical protein
MGDTLPALSDLRLTLPHHDPAVSGATIVKVEFWSDCIPMRDIRRTES